MNDKRELVHWIRNNISDDADAFCSMSEQEITTTIQKVLSRIMSSSEYQLYEKLSIIKKNTIIIDEAIAQNGIEAINEYYQKRLQKDIFPFQDELSKRKKEYDKAVQQYRSEQEKLESEKANIQIEFNSLSI